MRFNVPPGWPVPPPDWVPDPGWQPDPSWPPAPYDWQWWVEDRSSLDDQLLKGAKRLKELKQQVMGRRATEEMPVVTFSGPDPAAKWFGLAAKVAKFGPVHDALPGGEHVLDMVKALYDIEDEQSRVLHSIDANVKLLKEGPYRAGRLLLSEAYRLGDRDGESRRLLETAKDRFYDAQPLASSVQERTLVELHLGLVWLALGRDDDARYWLEQSYQSARTVIDELTKQAGNVKVLKTKWATTALSVYYPVGLFVIPLKLKRLFNADRANTALTEFLPVTNAVAACLNSLNLRAVVPTLLLTMGFNGERVLQETGVGDD